MVPAMSAYEALAGRIRLLAPLRHRDFRLLWIGSSVSMVGDGIYLVAIAWQVYTLDADPAAFAIVALSSTLPQVLLLVPAGLLADRFDRRHVMIVADLLRTMVLVGVATLAFTGRASVGLLAGLSVLFGVGDALFLPSSTAIVPALVPQHELVQANALDQFTGPIAATLLGPFLGGVLTGFTDMGWAFAADAATFAFSALMLTLMSHRRVPVDTPTSLLTDLREGLAFVRRTRWFWVSLAATAVAILCTAGAGEALIPFLVKVDLHGSAVTLGLVYAISGLAAMATAAVLAQRSGLPRRPITGYYLAWVIGDAGLLAMGLVANVWQLVLAGVVYQACFAAVNVLWFSVEYKLVPAEILGRVSSLDWMIVLAGLPLSFALVGPAAAAFGARATLVGAGALGIVAMIVPLFVPGALDPERDGSLATAPPAPATEPVLDPAAG
jgi:MFS family permease